MSSNSTPNRPSEPLLNVPPIILIIVAMCVTLYILMHHILDGQQSHNLLSTFAFIPNLFSRTHNLQTWFSMVSCSFLHADFMHLAINMLWLIVFGTPLACRLGVLRFCLFWLFAAFFSSMAYYSVHQKGISPLVGASGAISGMIGAAARYGFHHKTASLAADRMEFLGPILPMHIALRSRTNMTFIGSWLLINVATGMFPMLFSDNNMPIAWEAHIGGLLAGFLCVGLFDRRCREVL